MSSYEARSLKNKFEQGEFDDMFFQLTECLYKLKSGKSASENESLQLKKFIAGYYKNSDEIIRSIWNKLETELIDNGVKYISIKGRKKNLYRIYEKLLSHNKEILVVHDIIASEFPQDNLLYRNFNILAYLEGSDPFGGGQTPRMSATMRAA